MRPVDAGMCPAATFAATLSRAMMSSEAVEEAVREMRRSRRRADLQDVRGERERFRLLRTSPP